MTTKSSQIEDAALKAVETLASAIGRGVQVPETLLSLDYFIDKCIKSCFIYLKDIDLKLIWPNAKCLQAIASASSTANLIVFKDVCKFFVEQYNGECKHVNQKKIILEILNKFFQIDLRFNQESPNKYLVELKNDLVKIAQEVLDLSLNESVVSSHLLAQALLLLHNLFSYKKLVHLNEQFFGYLVGKLIEFNECDALANDKEALVESILMYMTNAADYSELLEILIGKLDRNSIGLIELLAKNNKKLVLMNRRLQEVVFGYLKEEAGDENEEFKLSALQCFYLTIRFENENKGENEITRKFFEFILENIAKFQSKKLIKKISFLFQIYSYALESKNSFEQVLLLLKNKFAYLLDINQDVSFEHRFWISTIMQFVCSLQLKVLLLNFF